MSQLIITAGAVQAEQARTLTSAQTTNGGVQACTSLDPATRAGWAAFYAGLVAWCNTPIVNFPWEGPSNAVVVTANTGDTMLAWETQLTAWQQRLAGKCPNLGPGLATFNPNPSGEQWTQWLKWGAVIVGFAATAYIVGQVASFIPKPGPRGPAVSPETLAKSRAVMKRNAERKAAQQAKDNPLPYRRRRAAMYR
jgi:hypothetical protein